MCFALASADFDAASARALVFGSEEGIVAEGGGAVVDILPIEDVMVCPVEVRGVDV